MTQHSDRLDLFAVTAPGLETLAAAELSALGIRAAAEPGGAAWEGTLEQLYAANLWLRTASRVVVRAGRFRSRSFFELERHARRLPWERFVAPGRPVRLRVTSRKSRLYHEGAIAERLLRFIGERVGSTVPAADRAGGDEEEDEGPDAADAQLFIVRFLRDDCLVSADASGALLHRRGYRQAVAKAPLRETLAAAMLLGSGWSPAWPLVDPMCGAGTILIEAALLARGIAPGMASAGRRPRPFAFEEWPGFDAERWERVVDHARASVLPRAPGPIAGSDRDAGAIEAASGNASRAGVLDDLELSVRPLSAAVTPGGGGWLVSNPPYGVRVGESDALRNLFAGLGKVARARFAGWTLALLSADPRLEAQVGVPFREALRTSNGGIPVRLVVGEVGAP